MFAVKAVFENNTKQYVYACDFPIEIGDFIVVPVTGRFPAVVRVTNKILWSEFKPKDKVTYHAALQKVTLSGPVA